MRKTHKQKVKMARKLLSKRELSGKPVRTPIFMSKTWTLNANARRQKELNKGRKAKVTKK
jgi:hypothetical protein